MCENMQQMQYNLAHRLSTRQVCVYNIFGAAGTSCNKLASIIGGVPIQFRCQPSKQQLP